MSADPEIRQTAADVNDRRQMEQLDQRSQRLYLWQKTPVAWSKAITVKLPGWGNVVLSRDGLECFHVVTLKITCLCLDSECKNVFCILRLQSQSSHTLPSTDNCRGHNAQTALGKQNWLRMSKETFLLFVVIWVFSSHCFCVTSTLWHSDLCPHYFIYFIIWYLSPQVKRVSDPSLFKMNK